MPVERRRPALADAFDDSLFELHENVCNVVNPITPRSPLRQIAPKRLAHKHKRGSRPSDVLNEDNYDFAICLKPVHLSGSNKLQASEMMPWEDHHSAILARLRNARLKTKQVRSLDGSQLIIKLKASEWRLEEAAECMRMKMRQRDGNWGTFKQGARDIFTEQRGGSLFRSAERQALIDWIVKSKIREGGAELGPDSSLSVYIQQAFPMHMYVRKRELMHLWVTFWKDPDLANSLAPSETRSSWGQICAALFSARAINQPLNRVVEYFGEEIGFYFAWTEFYTRWLIAPSVAGVVLFILQVYQGSLDQPYSPLYALFMALWATLFLVFWRRRSAELAYEWGVLHFEEEERTRPQFKGAYKQDEVTGEWALWYPQRKRILKYLLTVPVLTLWISAVFCVMVGIFRARDTIIASLEEEEGIGGNSTDGAGVDSGSLSGGKVGGPEMSKDNLRSAHYWAYLLVTPCLYGLLIPLFDSVFTRFAKACNDWENHRTYSEYQNHLILKVFTFRFVNVFSSLYYYAFRHSMLNLAVQLAAFMCFGQVWNHLSSVGYPWIKHKYRTWKQSKKLKNTLASQELGWENLKGSAHYEQRLNDAQSTIWSEMHLKKYDTFFDYNRMLIQFGYVSFFSMAFPLAPLLAFLNNIFEIRIDACKLLCTTQRPVACRAGGIGVWFTVLNIMSTVAVITNCVFLAITSKQVELYFPSPTLKILVLFIFEHFIFLLKFVIETSFAKVPRSVRIALVRERYLSSGGDRNPHHPGTDHSHSRSSSKRSSDNQSPNESHLKFESGRQRHKKAQRKGKRQKQNKNKQFQHFSSHAHAGGFMAQVRAPDSKKSTIWELQEAVDAIAAFEPASSPEECEKENRKTNMKLSGACVLPVS